MLLVSISICNEKRSWRQDERCTAFLIGTMLVVNFYASAFAKNFEDETLLMVGDLNVELGLCMEDDELREMCGPQCFCIQEVSRKGMWLEIMMEFNREALSTRLSCDNWGGKALGDKAWR